MSAILLAMTGMDGTVWADRIRALDPQRDVRVWPDVGDRATITYAMAWKPSSGALSGLDGLKVLFSLGAGVDALIGLPGLPDVPLVRVVDADLTMRMTEFVVLNVLMHHRRMPRAFRNQAEHRWVQDDQPAASAVRVGIMGLGELGEDAARKLKMLGFQVAGWSRRPKSVEGIETYAGEDERPAFLARSDILVVLLPLTPATRGIIDYDLLAALPSDGALGRPVLINAGRGGLQVERDIVRALDEGVLGFASLDVFETEPLPADSALWDHPKILITPHVAADSDPDALARYLVRQVKRFEAGEALINVVDRATGY